MMNSQAKNDAHRFEVHPHVETHFSWLRTRLSTERTLMSWVRTATALIGFGFTIVQFFFSFCAKRAKLDTLTASSGRASSPC